MFSRSVVLFVFQAGAVLDVLSGVKLKGEEEGCVLINDKLLTSAAQQRRSVDIPTIQDQYLLINSIHDSIQSSVCSVLSIST